MNDAIRWLLGVRTLDLSNPEVAFEFARPLPGWLWVLVIAFAILAGWWSYRRMDGTVFWRGILGSSRALLLILLALLIAGPRLIKPNETEEHDWVLVLADRSASMGIRDAAPDTAGTSRTTREDQLRRTLAASAKMWNELDSEKVLLWLGFDAGSYDLSTKATPSTPTGDQHAVPTLAPPEGRRTAIGASLEQAMRRVAARPVAGVVVLSDGRSVDEPSRALLKRLVAEKVPVFTVPLGSSTPVGDISIVHAEGPRSAFVNDFVPVEIELERSGGAAGPGAGARVELVDTATGLVLDKRDIEWKDAPATTPPTAPTPDGAPPDPARLSTAKITLTTQAPGAGSQRLQVRIVQEGEDLVPENNTAAVNVDLLDRPLRVAYFDGYPRWEYRYVKNLLVREKSLRASTLLLSSGRRFISEGEDLAMSLPRSPEEWREYDVIMIGDMRPEMFTPEQMEQLREHIASRGAGLVWIAGDGVPPDAWRGTPMEDLLPIAVTAGTPAIRNWEAPIVMAPSPLADRLGILRLAATPEPDGSWWPVALRDPTAGYSTLRWAQRLSLESLKPAVEVLATGLGPGSGAAGADTIEAEPLLVSMRFGAGRVLYLGTDETWRWRYGRGELFQERFWIQMIRLLGRESVGRLGRAALLEVSPRRAEVRQSMRIRVQLVDQALIDSAPPTLTARVIRDGALPGSEAEVQEVTLIAEPAEGTRGGVHGTRAYSGSWLPTESGKYRVELSSRTLAIGEPPFENIEVWLPDDELRRPEADHASLARLSEATEGKVLTPDELTKLPSLLANRRVKVVGEPEIETLWDSPAALIAFLTLLVIEWVGRRLIRLI